MIRGLKVKIRKAVRMRRDSKLKEVVSSKDKMTVNMMMKMIFHQINRRAHPLYRNNQVKEDKKGCRDSSSRCKCRWTPTKEARNIDKNSNISRILMRKRMTVRRLRLSSKIKADAVAAVVKLSTRKEVMLNNSKVDPVLVPLDKDQQHNQ